MGETLGQQRKLGGRIKPHICMHPDVNYQLQIKSRGCSEGAENPWEVLWQDGVADCASPWLKAGGSLCNTHKSPGTPNISGSTEEPVLQDKSSSHVLSLCVSSFFIFLLIIPFIFLSFLVVFFRDGFVVFLNFSPFLANVL